MHYFRELPLIHTHFMNIIYFLQWYPELEENVKNVPKVFVGNKIDLRDDKQTTQTGRDAPINF